MSAPETEQQHPPRSGEKRQGKLDGGRARPAAALAAMVHALIVGACCEDDPSLDVEAGGAAALRTDAGVIEAAPAATVTERCQLVGERRVEREDTFMDIASDYNVEVGSDCNTSGLFGALTLDQQIGWFDYILSYATALFECELPYGFLPGGVEAFGLANTAPIGAPSPRLGPDDAERLINHFLEVCGRYIALPDEELAAVRAHLERAATQQIDAALSAQLSECAPPSGNP